MELDPHRSPPSSISRVTNPVHVMSSWSRRGRPAAPTLKTTGSDRIHRLSPVKKHAMGAYGHMPGSKREGYDLQATCKARSCEHDRAYFVGWLFRKRRWTLARRSWYRIACRTSRQSSAHGNCKILNFVSLKHQLPWIVSSIGSSCRVLRVVLLEKGIAVLCSWADGDSPCLSSSSFKDSRRAFSVTRGFRNLVKIHTLAYVVRLT